LVALAGGIAGGVIAATRSHNGGTPSAASAGLPGTTGFSPASIRAQYTWPAGRRRAPDFSLPDQHGRRGSLRRERGRPIMLTFLDSHCHQQCPLIGRELGAIQRRLPPSLRPTLIAVSVNTADSEASTSAAARRWRFARPWYWFHGTKRELARVWQRYQIAVQPQQHDIAHSTAVYLIDRRGYQRALYLYPFASGGVARALRLLDKGES